VAASDPNVGVGDGVPGSSLADALGADGGIAEACAADEGDATATDARGVATGVGGTVGRGVGATVWRGVAGAAGGGGATLGGVAVALVVNDQPSTPPWAGRDPAGPAGL